MAKKSTKTKRRRTVRDLTMRTAGPTKGKGGGGTGSGKVNFQEVGFRMVLSE